MVEVLGRYSNLRDQGERLRNLLEIAPVWPAEVKLRTQKQTQHRLEPHEINQLKSAYQSGATLSTLAESFQIHRTTAAVLLERVGIARRGKGLSAEQVQLAIERYEAGDSTATIGTALGFSAETIRTTLIRNGSELRKRRGWR